MTQTNENEALGTDEPKMEVNRLKPVRGEVNKLDLARGESVWINSDYGLAYIRVCEKTGYPKIQIYGVTHPTAGVKYTKSSPKGQPLTLTPVARKNGDA